MNDQNKDISNQVKDNRNVNTINTPIYYTDDIVMTISNLGVVIDFGQRLMSSNQIQVITRVGMSREHAKIFLREIGKLLVMTEGQLETGKKVKN